MRTNVYGSTCRDNKVFLHIFDPQVTTLSLPALPKDVIGASMLNGGTAEVSQTDNAVTVQWNQRDIHSPSTIVVLELDGSAEEIAPINETPVNQYVKVRSSNKTDAKETAWPRTGAWPPIGKRMAVLSRRGWSTIWAVKRASRVRCYLKVHSKVSMRTFTTFRLRSKRVTIGKS